MDKPRYRYNHKTNGWQRMIVIQGPVWAIAPHDEPISKPPSLLKRFFGLTSN